MFFNFGRRGNNNNNNNNNNFNNYSYRSDDGSFQFNMSQINFNVPFQIPPQYSNAPQMPREEPNGVKYLGISKRISTYTGEVAEKEETRRSLKEGDKMILPEEVLLEVTQRQEFAQAIPSLSGQQGEDFPKVMIFEVSNSAGTAKAYGGVLEFNRDDSHAYIPRWIFSRLTDNDNAIELDLNYRYISVPNATFIKLLPKSKSFYDQNNPKAVLESILSKFTVLYQGLEFEVPSPSNSKELLMFEVVEVKPNEVGCIVDQDVQVDFAENKELFPDEEKPKKPVPQKGTTIDTKTNRISIANYNNDNNNSTTASTVTATKKVTVANNNNNDDDDDDAYDNGNNGYDDDDDANVSSFVSKGFTMTQSVSMAKDKGHNLADQPSEAKEEEVSGDLCDNCGKRIPTAQMRLHVLRCKRIYMRCPKCNIPIERTALESHTKEFHTEVKCEKCSATYPDKKSFEEHVCPLELVPCEYCGINIVRKEIEEHTDYCGSRTEACEVCGATVTKRDMKQHLASNCTSFVRSKTPQKDVTGGNYHGSSYNSNSRNNDSDSGYSSRYEFKNKCKLCGGTLHDFKESECRACYVCLKKRLNIFKIADEEESDSYDNVYFCPICNDMFNKLEFFTEHVRLSKCFKKSIHAFNEYVCKRCGAFKGDFTQLLTHFDSCIPKHSAGEPKPNPEPKEMITCPYCQKIMFGEKEFELHKVVCTEGFFDDDDDDYNEDDYGFTKSDSNNDVDVKEPASNDKKDSPSTQDSFVCPFCIRGFSTYEELNSHIGNCDRDPEKAPAETFECPFCFVSFLAQEDLNDHMRECEFDPERESNSLYQPPQPPQARDQDEKGEICTCSYCNKKFDSMNELIEHTYKCTKTPDYKAASPQPLDQNGGKQPIIPYAETAGATPGEGKGHKHKFKNFFSKTKSPSPGNDEIEDGMNAGNANGSFSGSGDDGKSGHACAKCGEKFDSKRVLTKHYFKCKGKEKMTFSCVMCEIKFDTQEQLNEHIDTIHRVD